MYEKEQLMSLVACILQVFLYRYPDSHERQVNAQHFFNLSQQFMSLWI